MIVMRQVQFLSFASRYMLRGTFDSKTRITSNADKRS